MSDIGGTGSARQRELPVWGERVRYERTHLGWSQAQLAETAGVTQATISRLERGARNLPDDARLRIALALRVNPYEVFPYEFALRAG